MADREAVLSRTRSAVVIAPVVLSLLLVCPMSKRVQAQSSTPLQLDSNRVFLETVAGEYGNIYNVIQDRDGFLWLAGINGVIKYYGCGSETVYSGERVSALFQDSDGLIWIAARSGIVVYDKKTGETSRFIPSPHEPGKLSGESLISFQKTQLFAEDRDGLIWIATMNGLNKYDKKTGRLPPTGMKPTSRKPFLTMMSGRC